MKELSFDKPRMKHSKIRMTDNKTEMMNYIAATFINMAEINSSKTEMTNSKIEMRNNKARTKNSSMEIFINKANTIKDSISIKNYIL